MKRCLSFILTTLLISSLLLSACSSDSNNAEETQNPAIDSTQSPAKSEPVNLSAFTIESPGKKMAESSFTKLVEEQFNIKFKWEPVPQDGATEKRQIALASGDYPDMFLTIPWVTSFSKTDLLKYGKQGIIVPLNDLIDQYAPNIKAAFDKYPLYKASNTAPDGTIYGLGQFNECYHCSFAYKLWLNTKWLNNVGLDTPKTTDDLKKVLQAFKTQDPNGNGKQDEIPISGTGDANGSSLVPYLMNSFVYTDAKYYLNVNGGKVESAAIKPEWKEGLSYIKSLYDEKLIDVGAFSQNGEALWKIGNNADAAILGAAAALHPWVFINVGENPNMKDYNPLGPVQGPTGNEFAVYEPPTGSDATLVLTNKASKEDQIAAIKVIDYLFTQEGQIRGNFGVEGIQWRKPQEGDVALNEDVEPIFALNPGDSNADAEPRFDTWDANSQYFQPRTFRDSIVQGKDIYAPDGYERRLQEATYLYDGKQPKEVFPYNAVWVDPSIVDEAAMLQQNIKDYIEQNTLQFIIGSKDLNKDWDAYVAGLDKLNLNRYLEIMQNAYDGINK